MLVPHDKYKKMSSGDPSASQVANQLQNHKILTPPPGLPATDIRAQRGEGIDRQKVELKRDKKLEQEMGEISDTESENSDSESGVDKDWISVWKAVK